MSTNFFAAFDTPCPSCNHSEEPVHIGKRVGTGNNSVGFIWNGQTYKSRFDWMDALATKHNGKTFPVITDETGAKYTFLQFAELISKCPSAEDKFPEYAFS